MEEYVNRNQKVLNYSNIK